MFEKAKVGLESIDTQNLFLSLDEKKVVLIDVRDPDECGKESIKAENTVKISRGFLEIKYPSLILKKYSKDNMFVVYCALELHSVLAAKTLKDLGFTNVRYLKGGLKSWKVKGFQTNSKTLQ